MSLIDSVAVSLSTIVTVALLAVPIVYPVPVARVIIAVSLPSTTVSSIGVTCTVEVALPTAKVAVRGKLL